jgi:hypothetical protein
VVDRVRDLLGQLVLRARQASRVHHAVGDDEGLSWKETLMPLFDCLPRAAENELALPPFKVDFNGEPHAGDFFLHPDGSMWQVQGRCWQKQRLDVPSEAFQVKVNRMVHVCTLWVTQVAVPEEQTDESLGHHGAKDRNRMGRVKSQ